MSKKLQYKGSAGYAASAAPLPRRRSGLNGLRLPVCQTGKIRYRDRTQAQDALTLAKHRGATARNLSEETRRNERRAYSCAVCDGFHLTSQASRGAEVGA